MNLDINDLLENESLKKEFELRDLDLSFVFTPTPDDLPRENRQLKYLLEWVDKYTECKNRKLMEAEGYEFPPIDPCITPENDWYIFERWVNGLPTRTKLKDHLPPNYIKKNPEELNDDEIYIELQLLTEAYEKLGNSIGLNKGIPARLVYIYLLENIDDEFEMSIEGGWVLDGCTGYCPDCFQRPWCDTGGTNCWTEDEEVGKMYLCDSVKDYVSASPVSLQILQQAEADEKSASINFDQDDQDLSINTNFFENDFETGDDDEIPF